MWGLGLGDREERYLVGLGTASVPKVDTKVDMFSLSLVFSFLTRSVTSTCPGEPVWPFERSLDISMGLGLVHFQHVHKGRVTEAGDKRGSSTKSSFQGVLGKG